MLLDNRIIPTRRHAGIVFELPKINHYKFPKNPYYNCINKWNNLPVSTSLIIEKSVFTKVIMNTAQNPYIKVL